jgi:hypothetical protein
MKRASRYSLLVLLIWIGLLAQGTAQAGISVVDSGMNVGHETSLALDANGYPVISYYDDTNGDLKLAHCNDPNCAPGGDSIQTVDSAG